MSALVFPVHEAVGLYVIKGTEPVVERFIGSPLRFEDLDCGKITYTNPFMRTESRALLSRGLLNIPYVFVDSNAPGIYQEIYWNTRTLDDVIGLTWSLEMRKYDIAGLSPSSNPVSYYFTDLDLQEAKRIHLKEIVLG